MAFRRALAPHSHGIQTPSVLHEAAASPWIPAGITGLSLVFWVLGVHERMGGKGQALLHHRRASSQARRAPPEELRCISGGLRSGWIRFCELHMSFSGG